MRLPISCVAAAVLFSIAHSAGSQVYPVRPLKIVAPFAANGAADIVSRLVAERLAGVLKQPVAVENRPGGGGTVGSQFVAQAAPDGYTLLYATGATLVTAPIFARTPGYDPLRSFVPVVFVSSVPIVMAVNASSPVKSFDELNALIKAAPGKFRYATFGVGSQASLTGELFKAQTGLDIREVVAKAPLSPAQMLANGDAELTFDASVVVAVRAKEGRIRPLVVLGHGRMSAFPDVPTAAQAGMPELTSYVWSGLVAPAGTPPQIVEVINRAMVTVMSEIETQAIFLKHGVIPDSSTPEEFRRFIVAELTKWARAVPLSATEGQGK